MKKKYIVPNLTIVMVNTEQFIAASPDPIKLTDKKFVLGGGQQGNGLWQECRPCHLIQALRCLVLLG